MSGAMLARIPLPVLTPGHEHKWWTQMKAFVRAAGNSKFMTATKNADLPATVQATLVVGQDDEAIEALEKHALLVAHLTFALADPSVSGLVERSMSTDWPEGEAHLIVQGFLSQYYPSDRMSSVELYNQLYKLKMKDNDDPTKLFNKMARCLNMAPEVQVDETQLVTMIISKLPKEYVSVVHEQTSKQGSKMTRQTLLKELFSYYRLLKTLKGSPANQEEEEEEDTDEDTEVALASYQRKCFKCDKPGHIAADCKAKGKVTRYNCNNCGLRGHKEEDCWELAKNAGKRPAGWKLKRSTEEVTSMVLLM